MANFRRHINFNNIAIKIVSADTPVYRNESNRRIHLFHTHQEIENGRGICTLTFEPNVHQLINNEIYFYYNNPFNIFIHFL